MSVAITETGIELRPDHHRVVARLFVPGREDVGPGDSRARAVLERILQLEESDVEAALLDVDQRFTHRHRDLHAIFLHHADQLGSHMTLDAPLTRARRLLVGATFTHEYSVEGAALCNPSIVLLPEELADGARRFVMSVRGIGEGHRSSIGFRTGVIGGDGNVVLDAPGRFPTIAEPRGGLNHRTVFHLHLEELGEDNESAAFALDPLGDSFTDDELFDRTLDLIGERSTRRNIDRTIEHMAYLARSSYSLTFDPATKISERVLWPTSPAESKGMEDARFVQFTDDDLSTTYYATYTAFDGTTIRQHLLQTDDFATFEVSPTAGAAAKGKGLALFPRRIGGRYVALSRSDRESNSVAFSDDLRCWPTSTQIQVPEHTWDLMQLGNCGSPIETSAGWLVLTHGVGAMRTYALGAILLDLDDPTVVIAAASGPIMTPDDRRRDGYVPNVLYTCGAVSVGDTLVLPYGIGDQTIGVATLSIDELLASMSPAR
jgi:predicted GH43/DUF377 family glycosyl hydrolase